MTTVSTIVTADSKKDGGIGHVRLEWPVTIRWNERSRSFGIGGHVGVEYATGERELAAEYLLYSRPDDLFLYDRGYPAFWLFAFHAKEQRAMPRITVRMCGMTFIPKSKPSWRMALRSALWS